MKNNVKNKETRLSGLQGLLEKLAADVKETRADYYDSGKDEFNGLCLLGEGYEHITYPGTAHVSQYRLYRDGILKINIFMGEESSRIEGTQPYSIPQFLDYLRKNSKGSLIRLTKDIEEIERRKARDC